MNKVVIVTGASSGIGEATVLDLAKRGCRVIAAARREDRLQSLAAKAPDHIHPVVCDVVDKNAVRQLVQTCIDKFGRIDVLVNNAGVMPLSYLKNTMVEEWDRMIDVNLKGALYAIAEVLPLFRKQRDGHIVNVGSVASRRVFPGGGVYCATKFGLRAVSEGLRLELDPKENVRVTMIEPGAVATELAATSTDREFLEESTFSLERVLDPEDIARSIAYAIEQPPHVNVEELMIMPKDQTR